MRRFWDQLTKSQKYTAVAGLTFVVALLLGQLAVIPYFEARQKVNGATAASERALREIVALGAEYRVLQQRSEEIRRMIEKRPPGFALFSYLERKAGEAGVKTNIRSINPLKSPPSGGYEEMAVEMKLDKLTTKQLTDFLYTVESREEMVRIRKISIAKMKENPEYLGALIQIFTYQPLPPGSR